MDGEIHIHIHNEMDTLYILLGHVYALCIYAGGCWVSFPSSTQLSTLHEKSRVEPGDKARLLEEER